MMRIAYTLSGFNNVLTSGRRSAARCGAAACVFAALLAAFVTAGAASGAPAAVTKYVAAPGDSLVINGTSTLHNWTAKTASLNGSMAIAGNWADGAKSLHLQSIHLAIPVESIKSSEGGGMDNTIYSAMDQSHHPTIRYQLTSAKLEQASGKSDGALVFNTIGTLRVDGVSKPIHLKLHITRDAGGLDVRTSVALKMTNFGVKPPTAMFGFIRSGNAITVAVDWKLVKQPAADTKVSIK